MKYNFVNFMASQNWRAMYGARSGHIHGGLAQLARAPALHAGGHRFDSDILHKFIPMGVNKKRKTKLTDLTKLLDWLEENKSA